MDSELVLLEDDLEGEKKKVEQTLKAGLQKLFNEKL